MDYLMASAPTEIRTRYYKFILKQGIGLEQEAAIYNH